MSDVREEGRIALIDLDGSMADYDAAMIRELKPLLSPGEVIPEDVHSESGYWEARMDLIKRQPGFWRNLKPIELGFRVYTVLIQVFRMTPVVLSKGPKRNTAAWTEKADWCAAYLPDASVQIVHGKGLTYGRVLYDDYPPYIEEWLRHRPRGRVIMRSAKYNMHFTHPQVLRIHDEQGIPELIRVIGAHLTHQEGQ